MTRIEDTDPGLPTRIRQLARKGLSRVEILEVLRGEGRLQSFVMLNKVIRRGSIAVAPPSRTQDQVRREILDRAKAELAQEIAAAKANPAPLPYKCGPWLEW